MDYKDPDVRCPKKAVKLNTHTRIYTVQIAGIRVTYALRGKEIKITGMSVTFCYVTDIATIFFFT